ncbi:hypothetical protein UVI_02040780 [Ustilaginoidea virens]|uniref:Uncharacterized protein n=1 Tax=Ustilaginoidea virens TaxID=1159556 RepID=A0A1B5L5B9_USTVR|nr:hypothetical protein UVI_02040780 [Ustilaginoidea virens]
MASLAVRSLDSSPEDLPDARQSTKRPKEPKKPRALILLVSWN